MLEDGRAQKMFACVQKIFTAENLIVTRKHCSSTLLNTRTDPGGGMGQ